MSKSISFGGGKIASVWIKPQRIIPGASSISRTDCKDLLRSVRITSEQMIGTKPCERTFNYT